MWDESQTQTMKMMYGVIAAALSDVGLLGEHHPCDYLNFYCLGNREPESPQEGQPMNSPENSKHVSGSSNLSLLQALKYKLLLVQKRFQIIQALVCRRNHCNPANVFCHIFKNHILQCVTLQRYLLGF